MTRVTRGQRVHGIWFVTFLLVALTLLIFRRQFLPYLANFWGLWAVGPADPGPRPDLRPR